MTRSLNKSRALAVALLVGVLALLTITLGYPFARIFSAGTEEIEDLQFRIVRLRRVAQSTDYWNRQVASIRERVASEDQFLEGGTAPLAAAALQARIKELVEIAGGALTSTQAIAPREEDGFTRIGVRVNLTGSIFTLREMLHEVEASRPYLLVSALNVSADRSRQAQAGQLRMDAEIYGYLRPK
jgi:general secretion pathway protein M